MTPVWALTRASVSVPTSEPGACSPRKRVNVRTPHLRVRRLAAAAVGGLLTVGLATGLPVPAHADDTVASGQNWSVTQVPGGYQVDLELDEPLPIVDDLPVLEVDGEPIGVATQSSDGTSLTATTTADVSDAANVDVAWSSGGEKVTPTDSPVTSSQTAVRSLSRAAVQAAAADDDGSSPGTYSYLEDDYFFGNQAVQLSNMAVPTRGELEGRIYLPTTGGARPTVILLHGRHTWCSSGSTWPCSTTAAPIPSFKGYEATAQNLATRGYAVISISANAINANDSSNATAPDAGAVARGQLVLDTLTMLRKASAGEAVSFHDNQKDVDVDLDTALAFDTATVDKGTTPTSGTNPGTAITAADLVGRFDLNDVGLMGHSRGGEGVVSAVNLNQALAEPFGIKSVIPLAPVDFERETVVDTPMLVMLPYCDGDVSNQQGQHFFDDSRYADDDALKSVVWVMGANHNFFNSVWTPGKYASATSDDWGATSTDAVCGPRAATNQRLSADDQYNVGVALMSAWFRMTLGGEDQFLPTFDGSADPTLESVPTAKLFTQAVAPSSSRADIEQFTSNDGRVRLYGSGTANICASAGARTMPQDYQACATASTLRTTSAMPHWTPASYAPNVPEAPMTKFVWTSVSGSTAASVRVTVPKGTRDASKYDVLTFKTAPDESVVTGTDLSVTVVDGQGAQWTSLVSALNAGAVNRLPISTSTTLNKIVLQQVSIPVSTLAGSVDVTDIREIRIAGGTGADATATGGAYLSDLAFASSAVGTVAGISSAPTVNMAPTTIEEGSSTDEAQAAVTLSAPVDHEVSTWFTLIGATTATAKAALAVQKVTFAPGVTCVPVTFTTYGDKTYSSTLTTSYKTMVAAPVGAIVGASQFSTLKVREDDLQVVTPPATPAALAPAVGIQGDVCDEYAASRSTQPLASSVKDPAPATTTTLSATGYRAGESVSFTDGAAVLGTVLASAAGEVSYDWAIPADAALGTHPITVTGAGSARVSSTKVDVLAPTTTALALSPAAPSIKAPVTLTATVTGADTAGSVEFFDGTTSLGSRPVTDGAATLTVPAGFLSGGHSLTAVFDKTTTANASTSNLVAFTLVKGVTTTVVQLAAASTVYGTGSTGTVTVSGGSDGAVSVTVDGTPVTVTDGSFELAASLLPGSHQVVASYAGSDLDTVSTTSVTYSVTKVESATAVRLARASSVYGTGSTGTVTVSGGTDGAVSVTVDGKPVTVTGGAFPLAATLRPGSHRIVASYAGSDLDTASTTTATYTVSKAASRLTVSAPTKVKRGKSATVTVTVGGVSHGVAPTGRVTIKVAGKATVTVAVPASGRVTRSVKLAKLGTKKVTVTYSGDTTYGASSATKAMKVVKKVKK
jgi:trimeric autotransporter adhesin